MGNAHGIARCIRRNNIISVNHRWSAEGYG